MMDSGQLEHWVIGKTLLTRKPISERLSYKIIIFTPLNEKLEIPILIDHLKWIIMAHFSIITVFNGAGIPVFHYSMCEAIRTSLEKLY